MKIGRNFFRLLCMSATITSFVPFTQGYAGTLPGLQLNAGETREIYTLANNSGTLVTVMGTNGCRFESTLEFVLEPEKGDKITIQVDSLETKVFSATLFKGNEKNYPSAITAHCPLCEGEVSGAGLSATDETPPTCDIFISVP